MKEKIKKILFNTAIFYSLFIVILMIITMFKISSTIELNDTYENKKKIIEYKEKVENLDQNECTKVINDVIEHYENTSYDGEVNLKIRFDKIMDKGILSYYFDAQEKCNISEEEKEEHKLSLRFLTAQIQMEEIFQRYYFQYELNMKDLFFRLIVEPNLSSVEYKINRETILEIIESLIEIASKEEIVNE